MRKILIIGMTNSIGGIETYIINLFRHMKNDYEFYFPYIENMAYYDEIISNGAKTLDLPFSRRKIITYYSKWIRAMKKYKFDAVYFNNCDIVSLSVLRIAKLSGVPVRIFHAHNSSNTLKVNAVHRLEENLNRKIVGKVATDLLACSKNAGDFIFGQNPYIEIKNGINTELFKFDENLRLRKREELCIKDERVIMYVGRFTNIKNPLYAIDIIKECLNQNDNYVGLICGDGPLMDSAITKVKDYGLENKIRILGNRNDVNELYSAADFLVMPSLFEGFPFVLVEAQCSGLKCLCSTNIETNTNIAGLIDYVPLESGADEWAKIIDRLDISCDRKQYSSVISDSGFNINKTVKLIEDILSN